LSCDEIKLHIKWRVVAAVSSGLLSGGAVVGPQPRGRYTESRFYAGSGGQDVYLSIPNPVTSVTKIGRCFANTAPSGCAQAFATLANDAGLTTLVSNDTVRIFHDNNYTLGWVVGPPGIVDCPGRRHEGSLTICIPVQGDM
jgi:hypothetical protein